MIEETWNISKSVAPRSRGQALSKLVEEFGEFGTEIAIDSGWLKKSPGNDGVVGEACDVINCVLDLVWLVKPDITKEEFENIYRSKLNKWYNQSSKI